MSQSEIVAVDLDIHVSVRTVDGEKVLKYALSSPSGIVPITHREAQTKPFKISFDEYRDRLISQLERFQDRLDSHGSFLVGKEIEPEIRKLGQALFRQLFPDEMKWMYRQWREKVRTIQISSDEWWIPWELIRPYDDALDPVVDDDCLGARYEVSRWLAGGTMAAAAIRVSRMACVEAGESGGPRLPSAVRERELLSGLALRWNVEDASPSLATFPKLAELFERGGLDLLHFVGHGEFSKQNPEDSRIVLADGRSLVAGELEGPLVRNISNDRLLVYFNACSTAQQGATLTSLSGWPDAWISRARAGAFVAPQWQVRDSLAFEFARIFYVALERGRTLGRAARLARLWVRRKDRQHATWLAFAVYGHPNARVSFGAGPAEQLRSPIRLEVVGAAPDSPRSHPVPKPAPTNAPQAPEIFVGRTEDLDRLKERLGIGGDRDHSAEVQILTAVRGWPGVGKTSIATVLAHDPDIASRFEGVLWASLGQEPDLLGEMAGWGRWLGSDDLYRAGSFKEASSSLKALLRNRRMVVILDDVWDAAHAVAFQSVSGPGCPVVVTTREPGVAQILAIRPEAVYLLDVLDEESAFDLLRRLAPEVVENHPDETRRLVDELERLPLALQVAGRLLREEGTLGWGIEDLLRDLASGEAILNAAAPRDRADASNSAIPTVSVLLERSTDRLDAESRERFRLLGGFVAKPATFGLDVLRQVWEVEDPRPTVRELVRRGLLEPSGEGRFQIHALLLRHAEAMASVV